MGRNPYDVLVALVELIPDTDPDKEDFVQHSQRLLTRYIWVAPECQHEIWMDIRELLQVYYKYPHALYDVLNDTFCNFQPPKKV
jgi:hypothetical protein